MFFLLLLFSFVCQLPGQTRQELEAKRKRLLAEINQTTVTLGQIKENKKATLDQYLALQRQIRKRQQLINTLKAEVKYADESIERTNQLIFSLQEDTERLKKEYMHMLRIAYRHKMNHSALTFLFSASSINDAFRRWRFLKQYDSYRKKQADLILATKQTMIAKIDQLETRKASKEELLKSQETQRGLLSQELNDKDKILNTLKADESRVAKDLNKQEIAHQELNDAIEAIIRSEISRNRKEGRSADALNNNAANPEVALSTSITNDFVQKKGRLPWPVRSGEITKKFGKQQHPTVKSIEITNNGIDIRTDSRSKVFAIFEGRVAGTQFIPGYRNTVIVQHGAYYTVYSNLENIFVKRGDILAANEPIGQVGRTNTEVHFEIWKEKQRLNPVKWVRKPGS